MNKKLIAAALAGAFAAPVAMADTTIYGFISAGVEYVQATGAKNNTTGATLPDAQQYKGRIRIQNENSRIGFKGGEDLGNGLKAVWQVEQGLSVDGDTTSNWATRNSFVGLQGGFGEVRLGRHDDAYKVIGDSVGLNIMTNTSADNAWSKDTTFGRAGARRANTALYLSPVFSGVQFAASYSADEDRTYVGEERTDASVYGAAVKYSANGLTASLGYNHATDRSNFTNSLTPTIIVDNKLDGYLAAVSYKFGDAMIGAGYEYVDYDTYNQDSWTLVGGYQFGAFGLKASYTMVGKADGKTNGGDYKANQWVLGATYDLSKRTQILAYATQIDNKKAATANFGVNNPTIAAGADPQAYGLALKHSF